MSVKKEYINASDLPGITTNSEGISSRFKVNDLLALNDPTKSYLSPLAVIALIDLNAFFAQVEQIRLNLSPDDPVVCVQWQSLIAVSYAARKYGIGRMDSVKTAKEKCPNVILAHAAVFKHGESHWKYVEGVPFQAQYKVSLDPYRRESRKINRILKQHCDLVEKASVDESYMDFGRLIFEKLLQLFPNILDNKSPDEYLDSIPKTLPNSLMWIGEIIKSQEEENEIRELEIRNSSQTQLGGTIGVTDWDDVCMIIGSRILFDIRRAIFEELGYTTSAGLARTKSSAKLAAGFRKPDNQTIIRNCSIANFFSNFQINDFTGFGGKSGDEVVNRLRVGPEDNSIKFIRENFTLEAIEEELHEDLAFAKRVYQTVRGDYRQELINRMEVKSMMSRKNFLVKYPVCNLSDANGWLQVFASDLYGRLIELDDQSLNLGLSQVSEKDKRTINRPRTLMLHLNLANGSKFSKQCGISVMKSLEKCQEQFKSASERLLKEILEANTNMALLNNGKSLKELINSNVIPSTINIPPVSAMSITISNFVKTTDSNLIDSYAESKDTRSNLKREFEEINQEVSARKLLKENGNTSTSQISTIDKEYINRLFTDFNNNQLSNFKLQSPELDHEEPQKSKPDSEYIKKLFDEFNSSNELAAVVDKRPSKSPPPPVISHKKKGSIDILSSLTKKKKSDGDFLQELIESMHCNLCNIDITDALEHNDFHLAIDLSKRING